MRFLYKEEFHRPVSPVRGWSPPGYRWKIRLAALAGSYALLQIYGCGPIAQSIPKNFIGIGQPRNPPSAPSGSEGVFSPGGDATGTPPSPEDTGVLSDYTLSIADKPGEAEDLSDGQQGSGGLRSVSLLSPSASPSPSPSHPVSLGSPTPYPTPSPSGIAGQTRPTTASTTAPPPGSTPTLSQPASPRSLRPHAGDAYEEEFRIE